MLLPIALIQTKSFCASGHLSIQSITSDHIVEKYLNQIDEANGL